MSTPADPKRINDVFANLYISDEEEEQDTVMCEGMASSPTDALQSSLATVAPSASDTDNVWKTLYNSTKITAVTNCPVPAHQPLSYCSCSVGLANLSTGMVYRTKVDCFIRYWDYHLLESNGAYEYNGDQASHNVFMSKNGFTPAEFAKRFAQGHVSVMFGPSGAMEDLVKCLLDFWVMCARLWRARYANHAEAKDRFLSDTYDMNEKRFYSHQGVKDLVDLSTAAVGIHEVMIGTGNHQSKVWLWRLSKLKSGFALKIASVNMCHQNWPVAAKSWARQLKSSAKLLADKYGYAKFEAADVCLGTASEMRMRFGLAPDPGASAEQDVLFVI